MQVGPSFLPSSSSLQMSSNENSTKTHSERSDPIPIGRRNRPRSLSISSASSDSASSSSPIPQTPPSVKISPSNSPILCYLAQSPNTPIFSPKRGFVGTAPVFEVEPKKREDREIPVAAHARRASVNVANRFSQPPVAPHNERGTNLLRRLSLSSAFKPPPPDTATREPPSSPIRAVSPPKAAAVPYTDKPNSATISTDGGKPRRVPSPMGERILKGHFDGFN